MTQLDDGNFAGESGDPILGGAVCCARDADLCGDVAFAIVVVAFFAPTACFTPLFVAMTTKSSPSSSSLLSNVGRARLCS
jgi:hypothetical protein